VASSPLLALLDVRHAPARSWRATLLIVGLIGAALLYGDGVITPVISVLSAIEGLKLDAPRLAPMVVPISLTILVGLRHNRVLHERVLLINIVSSDAPRISPDQRVRFVPVGAGITRVVLTFGFMEHPM
jgi:K+ transporter